MNSEILTETDRQGAWEATWSKYSHEIDRQITGFMDSGEEFTSQSLALLTIQIRDWLDSRQINGDAHIEWRRLRQDPDHLQMRIEQRIAHLVAEGRIRLTSLRSRWHY